MVTLGKTVTIIVGNIITSNDKILLIQESKLSCYGKWYLPAGRLEKHETLEEGARRECIEESGINPEYDGIFSIEMPHREWIRVTLIGHKVGGSLKMTEDKESVKADWVPLSIVIDGGDHQWPLRHCDISILLKYWNKLGRPLSTSVMPKEIAHKDIIIEIQIERINPNNKTQREILVKRQSGEVPQVHLKARESFVTVIRNFLYENVTGDDSNNVCGHLPLLGVQFSGSKKGGVRNDGVMLQVGVPYLLPPTTNIISQEFIWRSSEKTVKSEEQTGKVSAPLLVDHFK